MADMAEKLEALLSDPESLRNLQELAGMLKNEEQTDAAPSGTESAMPFDIAKLMAVGQALHGMENDDNIALLLALKPILSPRRAKRADKAVKLLRLYGAAALLQKQGLLQDFFGGEG